MQYRRCRKLLFELIKFMIHVFGDSYCDPCSGHLEQSKRWYNNLGEPTFIYGLAGSSIDWS